MLSDPTLISLDGGTTDTSFSRISTGNGVSTYKSPDGLATLLVRQTATKTRLRRELRVTSDKVSADPLNPAVNSGKSASVYIVIDEPTVGFSDVELTNLIGAVTAKIFSVSAAILQGQT